MNISELAGVLHCDDVTAKKFWDYHKAHQDIFTTFCRKAMQLSFKGFKHYGARTIMENIRHERDIEKGPDDIFKVNDHYTPYYASLFMYYYPSYKGFFEERKRKGLHAKRVLQQSEESRLQRL